MRGTKGVARPTGADIPGCMGGLHTPARLSQHQCTGSRGAEAAGLVRRPPEKNSGSYFEGDVTVTTNDAAAATMTARNAPAAHRAGRSRWAAAVIALAGLALAGCETGSNLLSSNSDQGPSTALATPPAAAATAAAKVAVAPVIGAPDSVAKQMQASLGTALGRSNVTVAQNATDRADYTLRGYVVSAREKAGVKVSYIWDVTDPAGQRVNRITGEEMIAGAQANRDPWSAVTPQVIDTISNKTAGQVAAWMPSQNRGGAVPVAQAPAGATAGAARPQVAAAAPPAPNATTGSIGRAGPIAAFVPNVSGAPGDGRISLTSALQRELSKNGVSLASAAGNSYRVEGVVKVGEAKDGKQPIAIDWHVKDPTGKNIGTVSQKNDIAAGALDGAWGPTADAAAAAASQGIIKLLPKVN